MQRVNIKPQKLIAKMAAYSCAMFMQACSQAETPKTINQSAVTLDYESSATLFKKTKKTYLSDAENSHLERLKLLDLGLEDKRDLARRLSNESGRAEANKDYKSMRYFAEKSHSIREDIVLNNPQSYLDRMSLFTSIASLGKLEQAMGNFTLAETHYEESLSALHDNPPPTKFKSIWERLVMWRYRDLGHLETELKKYESAKSYYEKYLEAVISNPAHEDYFYDQSEAYFFFAELSFAQLNWAEAVTHYENYFSWLEKAGNINAHRDRVYIEQRNATAFGRLGHAAHVLTQYETSDAAFASMIKILQNSYETNPADVEKKLTLALNLNYVAQRSRVSNKEYYRRALELLQELESDGQLPDEHFSVVDNIKSVLQ